MAALEVFYDGLCPICVREIAWYRRLVSDQSITWIDITGREEQLKARGIDPQQALISLHVRTPAGKIVTGVDAFILMWQQSWLFKPLAVLLSLPGIHALSRWAYRRSTRKRLQQQGRWPGQSCRRESTSDTKQKENP